MHSIKKTLNAKMVFLQSFLSFNKNCMQILATKLTRRKWEREREREEWERFGKHKIDLMIDVEMKSGGPLFILGSQELPLLDEL